MQLVALCYVDQFPFRYGGYDLEYQDLRRVGILSIIQKGQYQEVRPRQDRRTCSMKAEAQRSLPQRGYRVRSGLERCASFQRRRRVIGV